MRIYEVPLVATSVSVAIDLAEVNFPAAKSGVLCWVRFGQTTELGDAQEEQIAIDLVTGHTTSGTAGNSSVTATAVELGDPSFGGTCETFNTTQATAGTSVIRQLGVWNVRTEFLWLPPPEGRIWMPGATRAVIRMPAPADALTIRGVVGIGECG